MTTQKSSKTDAVKHKNLLFQCDKIKQELKMSIQDELKKKIDRITIMDEFTHREQQVFILLVSGLSIADIARKIVLSIGGIKWRLTRIYKKCDVSSREQLLLKFGYIRYLNL